MDIVDCLSILCYLVQIALQTKSDAQTDNAYHQVGFVMVTPIAPMAPMEVLSLIAVSLHLQHIDSQQNNNHYSFTLGIHPSEYWNFSVAIINAFIDSSCIECKCVCGSGLYFRTSFQFAKQI